MRSPRLPVLSCCSLAPPTPSTPVTLPTMAPPPPPPLAGAPEAEPGGLASLAAAAAAAAPVGSAAPQESQHLQQYRLTRIRSNNEGSKGDIDAMVDAADLGLPTGTPPVPRTTTLNWCSCQFATHTGLPCRHIVRLSVHEQKATFEEGLIADQWRIMSPQEIEQRVEAFYAAEPAAYKPQDVTAADRYAVLTSEFRCVAELGSKTKGNFELVRENISSIAERLRSNGKRPAAGMAAPPETSRGGQQKNPAQAASKGRPPTKRKKSAQEQAGAHPKAKKLKKTSAKSG